MSHRTRLTFGHQVDFHSGAALKFDTSFSGPGYDKVSLRSERGGDFKELTYRREGFGPRRDNDPAEIYLGNPDQQYRYGTRELIHPDGTIDILYGHFYSHPWPSMEWETKLHYSGEVPGQLPNGLSKSPDGAWINLPEDVLWLSRIPLPVDPAVFALRQPIGSDMAEMVANIERFAPASQPKRSV